MNRRTDPDGVDFSHHRKDICLKEAEWREIHEHIAGTKEYRRSLCDKLDLIRGDVRGFNMRLWGFLLVILIPLVGAFMWVGHMDNQVEVNTQRWNRFLEAKNDTSGLAQLRQRT